MLLYFIISMTSMNDAAMFDLMVTNATYELESKWQLLTFFFYF